MKTFKSAAIVWHFCKQHWLYTPLTAISSKLLSIGKEKSLQEENGSQSRICGLVIFAHITTVTECSAMNIMTVTAQFNDRRRMFDEYEKMGLLFRRRPD